MTDNELNGFINWLERRRAHYDGIRKTTRDEYEKVKMSLLGSEITEILAKLKPYQEQTTTLS